MSYVFEPEKFGFLPPKRMPKPLRGYLAKYAYVKVIAVSEDGSFWYEACSKYPCNDDRWYFTSGLYDVKPGTGLRGDGHTSHQDYSGCITSESYAKELLAHLFGTTTNEGTLKYGNERLLAKSLPVRKKKKGKTVDHEKVTS